MVKLPNIVNQFIKLLPKEHSGLKNLITKNFKKINFDKLKPFDINYDETDILNFYKQVIEQILSSNPETLELLKNLSVFNQELETNIDRNSVISSLNMHGKEDIFDELLKTGILKLKKGKKEIYEFTVLYIQDVFESLIDKKYHENAILYYEKKKEKYRDNANDDIEILFHKVKINPSEDLVDIFLEIANNIGQFEYEHKRLIDIAQELFILDDKYKAPILMVLGNLFSVIGNSEDAEKIYLKALEIYKNLAKKYYRIYLPYVAATQKNLGNLYTDLKRFEEAEKIYSEALNEYKELERQYYDVHAPDFHLKKNMDPEKSYLSDLKEYNELLQRYYDIYLPEEPSIEGDFGNIHIDLELLEDIQDGTIDSLDSYKALAKMSYDMYLIDIAKTQSNLGLIYSELMKFEDAERMHLEALKIKKTIAEHYPNQVLPELVLTLLDLGDLYARLNKFEDAEPLFNEALKISKQLAEKYPEIYLYNVALIQNSLGNVYSRLKRFEEAESMYNDALKLFKLFAKEDPRNYSFNVVDVQNNLGNMFLLLRDLDKAELYLKKALKSNPENADIIYNTACLESLRNNQSKALELLTIAIKLDKNYIKRALEDNRLDYIRDTMEFKDLTSE
ncbi:MAG: tetratricopeptide repeat protein [Promethearchaeota archaeon]|jgi:tetratricopeptide (TPR) repeat protein